MLNMVNSSEEQQGEGGKKSSGEIGLSGSMTRQVSSKVLRSLPCFRFSVEGNGGVVDCLPTQSPSNPRLMLDKRLTDALDLPAFDAHTRWDRPLQCLFVVNSPIGTFGRRIDPNRHFICLQIHLSNPLVSRPSNLTLFGSSWVHSPSTISQPKIQPRILGIWGG